MMINFISVGGPQCPDYLVKHYSRPLSVKFLFWMRLIFKLVDFALSRLPSIMWVGLIKTCESLNKMKTDLFWARGNSVSSLPLESNGSTFLSLQPDSHHTEFRFPKPPQPRMPMLSANSLSSLTVSRPAAPRGSPVSRDPGKGRAPGMRSTCVPQSVREEPGSPHTSKPHPCQCLTRSLCMYACAYVDCGVSDEVKAHYQTWL